MRPQTLAVVACLTTSACRGGDEIAPAFVRESRWAQQATVPSGVRVEVSHAQAHAMTVSQTWRMPLTTQWSRYLERTVRELEPSFRCLEAGPGALTCTRSLPGDSLTLTLTRLEDGPAVRVRLEARAD